MKKKNQETEQERIEREQIAHEIEKHRTETIERLCQELQRTMGNDPEAQSVAKEIAEAQTDSLLSDLRNPAQKAAAQHSTWLAHMLNQQETRRQIAELELAIQRFEPDFVETLAQFQMHDRLAADPCGRIDRLITTFDILICPQMRKIVRVSQELVHDPELPPSYRQHAEKIQAQTEHFLQVYDALVTQVQSGEGPAPAPAAPRAEAPVVRPAHERAGRRRR